MVSAGLLGSSLPMTASHERARTVVAIGSTVTGFKSGHRLLADPMYNRCGSCKYCATPESGNQYCLKVERAVGIRKDGYFAEYVIVDSREACVLPSNLSFESASPLACAGATVWTGFERAKLVPGQWDAIVGSGGGLGHLGVQFANGLGLKVIGIDARDEGLELTRQCGADVTIDARQGALKIVEEVVKATDNERADATLNLSDANSAAGIPTAATKNHGLMVQIAQVFLFTTKRGNWLTYRILSAYRSLCPLYRSSLSRYQDSRNDCILPSWNAEDAGFHVNAQNSCQDEPFLRPPKYS